MLKDDCIEILKYALLDKVYTKKINTEEIFDLFKAHTVLGIGYKAIPEDNMSDIIRDKWQNILIYNVINYTRLIDLQKKTVQLLNDSNIKCVILKGTAVGQYYPTPIDRMYGDIDILVRPDDYEDSKYIFLQNNYSLIEIDDYHDVFSKNNCIIELHRYPSGLTPYPDELKNEFYNGIDSLHIDSLGFPVLPYYLNGLVLLLHLYHHMYAGIGLRHLIDWRQFVEKELYDERLLQMKQILNKYRLLKFAKLMTRTCELYLGLKENENGWCTDVNTYACDVFLNYVYSCGNMGRMNSKERNLFFLGNVITSGFLKKHSKKRWFKGFYESYLVFMKYVSLFNGQINKDDLKRIKDYQLLHIEMGMYDIYDVYDCKLCT